MDVIQPLITLLATLVGALVALLGGWLSVGRQHRFNIEMLKAQTFITAWSKFITSLTEYRAAELRRLHLRGDDQEDAFGDEVRQLRTKCRDSLMQLALAEVNPGNIQEARALIEDTRSIGHATDVDAGLAISQQITVRLMQLVNSQSDSPESCHRK